MLQGKVVYLDRFRGATLSPLQSGNTTGILEVDNLTATPISQYAPTYRPSPLV